MRLGGAVVVVVACLGGSEGARADLPALPVAPTAQLAPLSRARPPRLERGLVRIAALGVELAAPPGAEVHELVDWAEVLWPGARGECKLQLHPQPDDAAQRQLVGTLPLACSVFGDGCPAWCDRLRAVRGGPAQEPYPSESPLIEIDSAWGDRSIDRAGVLVWRDGTVQFRGGACPGYRGRRGLLPAARVAALMAALEDGGLFAHATQTTRRSACEHESHRLYLRTPARRNALSWSCEADALVNSAVALIAKVVGDNPCARERP